MTATQKQIIANQKAIRRINNSAELKWKDSVNITTMVPDTGISSVVNDMGIGDTANERTGAEIKMTSFQLMYHIYPLSTSTIRHPIWVRVLLVRDKQANESLPSSLSAISDGILDIGIEVLKYEAWAAPYNHRTSLRYKILYDRTHKLGINAAVATGADPLIYPNGVSVKKKIPLSSKVKYTDTDAGITAIMSNSLILYVIPSQSNRINADFGGRLYFKDF